MTVYHTIEKYCVSKDKIIPVREQRDNIGVLVWRKWKELHYEKKSLVTKIKIREADGYFYVNSYPEFFSTEIENIVHNYYLSLSSRKKRPRIPLKKPAVKVYSTPK